MVESSVVETNTNIVVDVPGCRIDQTNFTINDLPATRKEIQVALALASSKNVVFLEDLQKIWPNPHDVNVLAVYIRRLRVKFSLNIENRRGIGYRLVV